MPERILRDYTTSEKFDGLAGGPEQLFIRLLTKVDDYGRFDGDPVNVRGACYPRAESLRANTVDAWLKELSDHHLILCYQVFGKRFLAVINFRQRLRTGTGGAMPKAKFPPPVGKAMDFRPDDGDWRAETAVPLEKTGGEPPEVPAGSGESRRGAASGEQSPPYAESVAVAVSSAKPRPVAKVYSLSSKPVLGGVGGGASREADGKSKIADSKGSAPSANVPSSTFHPPSSIPLLSESGVGGVVARIVSNKDHWAYDNCKVQVRDFTAQQLTTVLREQAVGKVTPMRAVKCWNEAANETHRAAVDGVALCREPAAYCVGAFIRMLGEAATAKVQTPNPHPDTAREPVVEHS